MGVIFLVNGVATGSWAALIPTVPERLQVGPAALGSALLAMAAGALLTMPVAGAVVGRTGTAPVVTVATLLFCAALPLPVIAPILPLLALGLVLFGMANGAMDVSMNAHGLAVERAMGRMGLE